MSTDSRRLYRDWFNASFWTDLVARSAVLVLLAPPVFALEPAALFFSNEVPVTVFNGSEGLLVGTNGFRLTGVSEKGQLGSAVSAAGDVDGDGQPDFIASAPQLDIGSSFRAGRAYIVWGTNAIPPEQSIGSAGATTLNGSATDDKAGSAVTGGGDFNGDGFDDVAVGIPFADPATGTNAGQVALVFGGSNRLVSLDLNNLNGTNGCMFTGPTANQQAGTTLAFAGDLNGDGLDDLLIGAPEAQTGRVYLIFGRATPPATNSLSPLNGTNGVLLLGESSSDKTGFGLTALRDFNGDGRNDAALGAPTAGGLFSGRVYVLYGRTNWTASLSLGALDGTNGFRFEGNGFFSSFGEAVAGADVNGDAKTDLAVGARNQNKLYTLYGTTNRTANRDSTALDGTNGFVWSAESLGGSFGASAARAGRVNFDDYEDLLVGAPAQPSSGPLTSAGRVYVLMGRPAFAATTSVTTIDGTNGFVLAGQQSNAEFGHAVASAGDVDQDTREDLLVGEWVFDYGSPTATNAGAIYLFSPVGIASYALGVPVLQSIGHATGTQAVTWASQPGATYDVYTNGLLDSTWGLAATIISGGATTTWSQAINEPDESFFHIKARR